MVASAKIASDLLQAMTGQATGQVHAYLPRQGDGAGAFFRLQIYQPDAEPLGNHIENIVDRNLSAGRPGLGADSFLSHGKVDRPVRYLREHSYLGHRALKLASVGVYRTSDKTHDVLGQFNAPQECLRAEYRHAGFVARPVYPGDQAPVEPADEPFFQLRFLRASVGRKDDLLLRLVERVEGVEKFFLALLVVAEELNVVYHQHIDVAVSVAEIVQLALLDSFDEMVHKRFAGQELHPRVGLVVQNTMAGSLEQVRLAQAARAVEEQRVVRLARGVADGTASCVGQAIARA